MQDDMKTIIVEVPGNYLLSVDGYISKGNHASIRILINEDPNIDESENNFNHEDANGKQRPMTGKTILSLNKNDKINVKNYFDNSIYSSPAYPFTLLLFKL